jgi:hypothetical protein
MKLKEYVTKKLQEKKYYRAKKMREYQNILIKIFLVLMIPLSLSLLPFRINNNKSNIKKIKIY